MRCQLYEMSGIGDVRYMRCQVFEMSGIGNVRYMRCLVYEMSGIKDFSFRSGRMHDMRLPRSATKTPLLNVDI
jgi:hypothetical protein